MSQIDFSDKSNDELLNDLRKVEKSLHKTAETAFNDGRNDLQGTPIDRQGDKYREMHEDITNVLIDRGVM